MPEGQYFIVAHPALNTEEIHMAGNAEISGEKVAKDRQHEATIYGSRATRHVLRLFGIRPLCYDEAVPNERLTVADVLRIMGQA
jgi:hypothetical protein